AAGTGTLTTAALAGGPHTITATYGGDATYSPGASSAVAQTVSAAATTTVLASNREPSYWGYELALTATVSSGVAGTPTGTVTFKDGTTIIGSSTVSGGVAALVIATRPGGSHCLTALDSGDAG